MKRLAASFLALWLCMAGACAQAADYKVFTGEAVDTYAIAGDPTKTLATLTVHYPQLAGFGNEAIQASVNAQIVGYVMRIAGYDMVCTSAREAYDENYLSEPYPLEVGGRVDYAGTNLLSIYYEVDTYLGGAHGSHDMHAQHLDLTTGQSVTFADLVTSADNFQAFIAQQCISAFQTGGYDRENGFFEGYEESIRAWPIQNVVLTNEGLCVFFQQYEVAPYASGAHFVNVPLDSITPYLNARGRALLGR